MNKIIYIGNKLSGKNTNMTYIETLGGLLESEHYDVVYASNQKNQLIRLLDMIFTLFFNFKNASIVLIDTYSTSGFWFAFVISQLCRLLKISYIPILHGGNLPNRLAKNPLLCKLIFDNAKVNVAPSQYLFVAFCSARYSNVVLIPNIIKINDYKFFARTITNPRLLWVRSFNAIYNPKMAIFAFSAVKKHCPNAQLCMVGPNDNKLFLECKQLATDLKLEIHFTGKLSKYEWINLSNKYNIFINTTHFDNTPLSVIEAMAVGLLTISTNVGGIPFLIENGVTGILVNDNDAIQMANAIVNVIDNHDLCQQTINNARLKVENFDWNIIKYKWFDILN